MSALTFSRAINEAGNIAYLNDETNYVTLGITRNTIALYLLVKWKKSEGSVNIVPSVYDPSDPALDQFSWSVDGGDGVYEARVFGMPLYVAQTSGIVFKDGLVQEWGGSSFAPVSDTDLWGKTTAHGATVFSLINTQLSIKRDEVFELRLIELEKSISGDQDHQYHKKDLQYSYVDAMLQGASMDFSYGEYISAELKIESGLSYSESVLNAI